MALRFGTANFVSLAAAVKYYKPYENNSTAESKRAVAHKLKQGEIHIGAPALKPGQRLFVIPGEGRYGIEEVSSQKNPKFHKGEQILIPGFLRAYTFIWSPERRPICTIKAPTLAAAKTRFKREYRTSYAKYMGEVYVEVNEPDARRLGREVNPSGKNYKVWYKPTKSDPWYPAPDVKATSIVSAIAKTRSKFRAQGHSITGVQVMAQLDPKPKRNPKQPRRRTGVARPRKAASVKLNYRKRGKR